jgi:choline-sulfatase
MLNREKNLLVIMSDEHQNLALGCAGHPFVKTPHLDALAKRGIRFTKGYTPSPICVPARASFATGRYVHDIRLWDNAMPYIGNPKGWGHALQAKGIRVESIGKLHYRHEDDDAGFDVEHIPMQVVGGHGMVWGSIRREDERVYKDSRMLGPYIGPGESNYTRYDNAIVECAQDWFHQAAMNRQPWCLYVGLVAPHFPLIVPQEFLDLYPPGNLPPIKLHPRDGYQQHPWVAKQAASLAGDEAMRDEEERQLARSCYYGLVSWLDHNVGRIVDSLKANGLLDDTTIIYTTDHGDNVGARGLWGKSNMYEESVGIPMIMTSDTKQGSVCDTPVTLMDVSETILDHFGVNLDGERPGESLYSIANAPVQADRVVFSEYHAVGAVSGCYMVRKGDWKLIHYQSFDPELFNLAQDPEEQFNRAFDADCASKLQELYNALHAICDPVATNAQAFADQDDLIAKHGGLEKAAMVGAPAATPPPSV